MNNAVSIKRALAFTSIYSNTTDFPFTEPGHHRWTFASNAE